MIMKAKILRILVLGLFVSLLTVGISDAQPRIKKKIPKRSEYVSLDELHKLWLVPKDYHFHLLPEILPHNPSG